MFRFLHLKTISINIKYIKSIKKSENQYTIDMITNGSDFLGFSLHGTGFITSKGVWEQIHIFKNEPPANTDFDIITKFLETGESNNPLTK